MRTGKSVPEKEFTTIGILRFIKWVPALLINPLPAIVKIIKQYGDIILFQTTKYGKMLLINDPDMIKHILKTNQDNYSRRKAIKPLEPLLGDGLFNSEGKLWEQQHKLIKPAFHEDQIKLYYEVISEETSILKKIWNEKAMLSRTTDVELDVNILMLKILIKTQISSKIDIDFQNLINGMRAILIEASMKNQNIQRAKELASQLVFVKLNLGNKGKKFLDDFQVILDTIREQAHKQPESKGFVLTVLENARDQGIISDKQVRDELMNFIFAGFDTTASALTWSLYCYSKYPEFHKKLLEEIEILPKPLTIENLTNMPFNKMFIQEAMRLYPPVWSFFRVSEKEDEFEGYKIPAKASIMICPYALHRNPDIWENPEQFDPNRFENENMKGKAFAYIPFGQGRRVCIGKPMAMMELQLIFPELINSFNLELVSKKTPVINPGIIIKVKKPMLMKPSKR